MSDPTGTPAYHGPVYPGPKGTLLLPQDGATWDNASGFGLGHVVYQGIDCPYNAASPSAHELVHVKTHHISLTLQLVADPAGIPHSIVLAHGLAPNSANNTVDVWFQIPVGAGGLTGKYYLLVEETQEGTRSDSGAPAHVTFRAASPEIYLSAGRIP